MLRSIAVYLTLRGLRGLLCVFSEDSEGEERTDPAPYPGAGFFVSGVLSGLVALIGRLLKGSFSSAGAVAVSFVATAVTAAVTAAFIERCRRSRHCQRVNSRALLAERRVPHWAEMGCVRLGESIPTLYSQAGLIRESWERKFLGKQVRRG